ncbi:MAG: PAS domain-containing protein [Planctomycetes bacterium]|nr:PAS domain-containing protein [Planctomycetota bacterium]
MTTTLIRPATPTGRERFLGEDELIVSKTDVEGRITYANKTFQKIAGYSEDELLGAPHNIVRHPDMPRCVFRLLWDTIGSGREIFAYVLNMAKTGDHYWVFAHVTPSFDASGRIVGYHSNRRAPERSAVKKAHELYQVILAEERKHQSPQRQVEAGLALVTKVLTDAKISYDEFVFSL